MQTCPECGGRNEDGELFCGECGTYLEWAGAPQAGPPAGPSDGGGAPAGGSPAGAGGDLEEVPAPERKSEPPAAAVEPSPAEELAEPAADTAPSVAAASSADTAPLTDPAPSAEPAGEGPTDRPARRADPLGGMGVRASRLVRQATDQATGGAVSRATGTAGRARSQARNVTAAPGRAAGTELGRAAGRAGVPVAVTGAATAGAHAAATPASPAASSPSTPAPVTPAPVTPAPVAPSAPPAARQPAARKPGAPAPRRPVPQAAEEEEPPPRPGELICGACGAGNAAHRNFCRRCGASLADAPVQPERSWWRRLLRPDRRPGPAAGTRPRSRRRRRFPTGLVVTLVVLGLIGAGAWYFRDTLATAYAAVLDRVAGDDPINPSAVTSSSERPDRAAAQVRDGILDRSWAPEGAGPGEWVELELPEAARLVRVIVVAGNGGEEDQRLLEARPQRVRLTLTTESGEQIEDVELTDTGEPQGLDVGVSDVEAVRLTILSVYGAELQAPVALAEVELQGRG